MIACLLLPYFAATIERRDDRSLAKTPLVLGGQAWEPRPLYAFSQEAARRGVQPGMSLRLAHSLLPQAHFMPAAPPRYQAGAGEVTELLTYFTPLVVPEQLWQQPAGNALSGAAVRCLPARYTVDLDGLPTREALPVAQEMGRSVRREAALEPAVGLAQDAFTAQVAATLARPGHLRPVPAGEERAFLASQSLAFLPLAREVARRLRLMGVRTLGHFASLPAASVLEQFGTETLVQHRLAKGEARQPLAPATPEKREQVSELFEPALEDRGTVEAVLANMARTLAGRLQENGQAAGSLRLTVAGERGERQQQGITLRRPAADAGRLDELLRTLLDRTRLTGAVAGLALTAGELVPAEAYQLSLFKPASRLRTAGEALHTVMARHRQAVFCRPAVVDPGHPLPEMRFQMRALA